MPQATPLLRPCHQVQIREGRGDGEGVGARVPRATPLLRPCRQVYIYIYIIEGSKDRPNGLSESLIENIIVCRHNAHTLYKIFLKGVV